MAWYSLHGLYRLDLPQRDLPSVKVCSFAISKAIYIYTSFSSCDDMADCLLSPVVPATLTINPMTKFTVIIEGERVYFRQVGIVGADGFAFSLIPTL